MGSIFKMKHDVVDDIICIVDITMADTVCAGSGSGSGSIKLGSVSKPKYVTHTLFLF